MASRDLLFPWLGFSPYASNSPVVQMSADQCCSY